MIMKENDKQNSEASQPGKSASTDSPATGKPVRTGRFDQLRGVATGSLSTDDILALTRQDCQDL
jgi:hypothetical protein